MWIVVLGPGDTPAGAPAAFTIQPGGAIVLEPGVWHAGPQVLADGTLAELLEAKGGIDRLDRVALRDLLGAEGVRVLLPEEPGAPGPAIDLASPHAVLLDAALAGRLRVGCLLFDELDVRETFATSPSELDEVAEGLRGIWKGEADLAQVPAIASIRAFFEGLELDPTHVRPPSELLFARVLTGEPVPRANTLVDALTLCTLRTGVPAAAYDAAQLAAPLLVRRGATGEDYAAQGGGRVRLEARPVLCDRDGPFGSLVGDADRASVRNQTRRALVVMFLDPATDDKAANGRRYRGIRSVRGDAEGRLAGRLIVG